MTLRDALSRKSPMKMIYRKFPKTAPLPVTWFVLCLNGTVKIPQKLRGDLTDRKTTPLKA